MVVWVVKAVEISTRTQVALIIESASVLIVHEPFGADHSDQNPAQAQRILNVRLEVRSRLQRHPVIKDALSAESISKPIEQPACIAAGIVAPIADEDTRVLPSYRVDVVVVFHLF